MRVLVMRAPMPRRGRVPAVRAREHRVRVVRRQAVRGEEAGAGTEVEVGVANEEEEARGVDCAGGHRQRREWWERGGNS
jgi:hypothetical protein